MALEMERGLNLIDGQRLPLEEFDEFWYKGQTQERFTTIEFGYVPFVPASEIFIMQEYKQGDGRMVGPQDLGHEDPDWAEAVGTWQALNGISLSNRPSFPSGTMQSEAEKLSRELSDLLEDEKLSPRYTASAREEIEALAFMEYVDLLDSMVLFDSEPDLPRVNRKGGLSKETVDVMNENQAKMRVVLAANSMLMQESENQFSGARSRAFETTESSMKKSYQGLFQVMSQSTQNAEDAWEQTVHLMMNTIQEAHSIIGQKLETVYGSIPSSQAKKSLTKDFVDIYGEDHSLTSMVATAMAGPGAKNVPFGPNIESINYTARQILARFEDIYKYGEIGGNFTIISPLGPDNAGVATITPQFSTDAKGNAVDSLSGWGIQTMTLGGDAFREAIIEIGGGAGTGTGGDLSIGAWAGFAGFGESKRHMAGLTALLAVFHYRNGVLSAEEVQIGMNYAAARYLDQLAGDRGRFEMVGEGYRSELNMQFSNMIAGMTGVSAVELLSTKQAADSIRNQIQGFWSDPNVKSELTHFYKKAMRGSGRVTQAWREDLNIANNRYDPYNTNNPQPMAIGSTAPFLDQRVMQGIGVPFWMTFGREAAAFNRFKSSQLQSRTIKRWEEKGLARPDLLTVVQRRKQTLPTFRKAPEPFYQTL